MEFERGVLDKILKVNKKFEVLAYGRNGVMECQNGGNREYIARKM